MISISLRELMDRVGISTASPQTFDIPSSQSGTNFISSILQVEGVRSAIIRKVKADYARDKSFDLIQNISDPTYVDQIQDIVSTFVSAEAQSRIDNADPFNGHPLFINKQEEDVDHLRTMITDLARKAKPSLTGDTSAAGLAFGINVENYVFELTPEEQASLDESELATLSVADIQPEAIVAPASVYMSDASFGELYQNQPHPVYTGVDMRVIMMTPNVITQNLSTKVITYSIHGGLIPVKTLGRKLPKGFAEGDTNIAGTIVATMTVNDPMFNMQPLNYGVEDYAKRTQDVWRTYLLPDQLPRFDMVLLFSNEAGFTSSMVIFGIKFTDVGSVIAMSDSEIEVTYTYSALDIDLLRTVEGERNVDGTVSTFDISQNNEYLARRKRAYDGKSQHRDHFEVGTVYSAIDRRSKELQYNKLRMAGFDLTSIYRYDAEDND